MKKDTSMGFEAVPGGLSEEKELERLRRQLDRLLSPETDIGVLELSDFIDVQAIQSLMDDFYALAHIPMAIVDLKGRVLVGVGWQPICVKFHRVHPVTCANCIESDLLLSAGVPAGEFKLYKCRNNMWDIATPIMVGGQHAGNFFSGQFFFDDELPEYGLFRAQARQYGFNEEEYLAALDQVPRLSRETVNRAMAFFVKLAQMISLLSYSNIQLTRSLAERDALMDSLRESEQRWATTLTSVGDGVIATDVNGNVTFLNRVAEELTGWTLPEAAQNPVEEVFHIIDESSHRVANNPVRKALETGTLTGLANHTLLVRKDGTEIAVDDSGAPIQGADNQITGAVLVFRDITERRQAERELGWLASFPMIDPNPILEIGLDNQIEYSNPKARELFPDLPEKGVCHPYLAEWDEITEKSRSDPDFVLCREVAVGDRYYQQSIHYTKEYGRIRTYGMDITERKWAEEVVNKYAEELTRSNRELEQFAYIASHDLNEPLRKVEAFGGSLLRAAANLDEQQHNYVQRMVSAAKRMRQMVDGLLTLSRVTTQGQPFTQVDLAEVITEVLSDLEVQVYRTGGKVEVYDLPLIEADRLQMCQLMQNLISNALKYHQPAMPPIIKVSSQPISPTMVQILVADHGIGFEEGHVDRIFQPFQRLVGRNQYEGTGMGLAICKKIVERHGGSITAESTLDLGSTFLVTLPIQQPH